MKVFIFYHSRLRIGVFVKVFIFYHSRLRIGVFVRESR